MVSTRSSTNARNVTMSYAPESIDKKNRTCRMVISTAEVASDGDIVLPTALVNAWPGFSRNPICVWNHPWVFNQQVSPETVLGRVLQVLGFEDRVEAIVQFAVDENPTARTVFDLISSGYLRACSIGWLPITVIRATSPRSAIELLPGYAQDALRQGRAKAVHVEIDWFELSITYVGADRNALAKNIDSSRAEALARALGFRNALDHELAEAQARIRATEQLQAAQAYWAHVQAVRAARARLRAHYEASRPSPRQHHWF